jgi:hypothetical protein
VNIKNGPRKLAALLVLFTCTGLLTAPEAFSATRIKPGASCPYDFENRKYQGKTYTCIKVGKKWVWDKGVISSKKTKSVPSPSPSPTKSSQAEIVNELAGLTWMRKSGGAMNLSLVMKSIKSNYAFIADGIEYQTSFPDKFTPLDIWQDKIIACPSYCLNEFFVSDLKGGNLKPISMDKIQHPDLFTYSLFKGANFGKDSRYVFALTSFGPIDGVKSVLYRIDTLTGSRSPIYSTYCYSTVSKSCAYGYMISGLKVSHKTNEIAIAVEAIGEVSSGYTSSFVMTISQNASPITLKSVKNVASNNRIYYEFATDSIATWRKVNNVVENQTTYRLSGIQFLESGDDLIYIKASGEPGRELNQICVLPKSSSTEECDQVSPFKSIYEVTPLGEGKVLYQTLDYNSDHFSAEIFDLQSKKSTPITNYTLKMNLHGFSIFG